MKLKAQLESGEILPEQVKDSLDFNVPVPEDEKPPTKEGSTHRKTYKLRYEEIYYYIIQMLQSRDINYCKSIKYTIFALKNTNIYKLVCTHCS